MRKFLVVFGGFASASLLAAIAPLTVLPFLARAVNSAGWVSVSVATSIGSVGATIVLFGWWIAGPAKYAELQDDLTALERLYKLSLWTRTAICIGVLPITAALSSLLARPGWGALAATVAVATALSGLSPGWYCIAAGRPAWLMAFDALPRLLTYAASGVAIAAWGAVWAYPTLVAAGQIVSLILFATVAIRTRDRYLPTVRTVLQTLRHQAQFAAAASVGSLYAATPTPIASAVLPTTSAAAFASGDRLYRLAQYSIVVLGNTLQSWVLRDRRLRDIRAKRAIASHAALGVIGGVLLVTLGPFAATLLFGEVATGAAYVFPGLGAAFLFVSISTSVYRTILGPRGMSRVSLFSTALSALVGVPSMVFLGEAYGLAGIAAALALSEFVNLAFASVAARIATRRSDGQE